MANARRKRNNVTNDDVFEIALSAALNRLLAANQIQATDRWHFAVNDDTLVITRARQVVTPIEEPDE
jgi:hypothetical protein